MHWPTQSLPAQRVEAWGNDRLVRCFVQRPTSLMAMLLNAHELHGQRDAIIDGDQRWTYAQMWHEVHRTAQALQIVGIESGDRVALFVSNRAEFIFVLFAVQYLGAIAVPVGTREQRPGLAFILNQCEAKAVVFDGALADRIPSKADVPSLQARLSLDDVVADDIILWSSLGQSVNNTELTSHTAQGADVAVILYTSGTTGNPKGAMLTQQNIAHSVMHFEHGMGLACDDKSALAVPASHVTGLIAIIATMVHVGGSVVVLPEFKAASFLDTVAREKITHTLMVPAMYNLCLMSPNFQAATLQSWRLGGYGGAPMPVHVIEQLAHEMPQLDLRNAYGATETTSPVTLMPAGANSLHADTVGAVLPCGDVRVMDDEGCEVAAGETGELWISGPMVVPGYWNNPQATMQSFTAGYWHSGDLGSVDPQGFVRIFDRKKDMLNRGGFKIYSVEVENCLTSIDGILEAAIVGKPCPVLGERVHAFVYAPNDAPQEPDVISHCRSSLADYKVPESITWLDQPLPRNANGKVLKRLLRAEVV
ncbi:CaiC Acyl-CoA synthetases (AMP-forming)/AMP-acid ligases II [Burkholderiaceae bacterium]